MTKRTVYLIPLAFVLITGTGYLDSMELEKENSEKLETLQKLHPNLSTYAVTLMIKYEYPIEKVKKEIEAMHKAQQSMYFYSPCGSGSGIYSVVCPDKEKEESARALLKPSSRHILSNFLNIKP